MFPSSRVADSSTFDVIHACTCRSRGSGGGGVGGPDPIPGKSQVLSNSIEIGIWTSRGGGGGKGGRLK